MGKFKYTNLKTGRVYTSFDECYFYDYNVKNKDSINLHATEKELAQVNNNDMWIIDEKLAEVLECEVEEINDVLSGKQKNE